MGGKLTLALVLITAGVLFLLKNLGQLSQGWWEMASRLWPLIPIFIGIEILVGRGRGRESRSKNSVGSSRRGR